MPLPLRNIQEDEKLCGLEMNPQVLLHYEHSQAFTLELVVPHLKQEPPKAATLGPMR